MTADDFRRIALSLPEVLESAHMDHPDFRVAVKSLRRSATRTRIGEWSS